MTLEYKQIAITDNKDQEPINTPNQITAVLNFCTYLLHPIGEEAEPLVLFFAKIIVFFLLLDLSHVMSPAVHAGCHYCFHNL